MKPRQGKAPAFSFYPADWLADADTRVMSPAERGWYIDLLAFSWREHGLPGDPEEVRRLLGDARGRIWQQARARIMAKFSRGIQCPCGCGPDDRLRNPRLEQQRKSQLEYSAKQAAKGEAGARARWDDRGHAPAMAEGMAGDSSASASASAFADSEDSSTPVLEDGAPSAPPEREPDQEPERDRTHDVRTLLASIGAGKAMAPRKSDRSPEERRLDELATKAIDRIRVLEAGQAEPFDPGKWWHKWLRVPVQARLETLLLLGRKLEAGDRPLKPWGYCNDTVREKKANYYADRAAAESEARRRANGRMEPAVA